MTAIHRLCAAARNIVSRLGSFPLADRAAVGFGLMTALFFCAMLIAGLGTHAARTSADTVRSVHLPLMDTALNLEGVVYEAIFHASMFGISGDMASYSGARIRFSAMRDAATALGRQAGGVAMSGPLVRDLETIRELAARLDMLVEKKRTVNETLGAERARLRRYADIMGEILTELQARTASATTAGGNENLDEKARLLILNGFALTVEEVTGRALAAGLTRSPDDLAAARRHFAQRWDEAREACRAAAELPASGGGARQQESLADDLAGQVAVYRAVMQSIHLSLEEAARANAERADVIARLATLTRGTVDHVRDTMRDAAERADIALRGATATLFACALLACILATGAAVLFFRSRPMSLPVTTRDGQGIIINESGALPRTPPGG